jgi:hypothetical protein
MLTRPTWYKGGIFVPTAASAKGTVGCSICIAKRSAPGIASRDPFETRCWCWITRPGVHDHTDLPARAFANGNAGSYLETLC